MSEVKSHHHVTVAAEYLPVRHFLIEPHLKFHGPTSFFSCQSYDKTCYRIKLHGTTLCRLYANSIFTPHPFLAFEVPNEKENPPDIVWRLECVIQFAGRHAPNCTVCISTYPFSVLFPIGSSYLSSYLLSSLPALLVLGLNQTAKLTTLWGDLCFYASRPSETRRMVFLGLHSGLLLFPLDSCKSLHAGRNTFIAWWC